jgi:NAD(P)-dependent dehydrogenase (short-subunit alcohol dehydrogenase family)
VTGAASGIGKAVASRLTRDAAAESAPARILLVDRSEAPLRAVAAELSAQGAEVAIFIGDLAEPDAARASISAAEAVFGGIDALISNAGTLIGATSLLDLTLDEYDRTFAVNTRATWLLAKAAHPLLKASGGCLVATASISGDEPTPFLGNYSSTKAALIMLVRQLAYEWGADGIRCNCVSPGTTRTGINDFILSDDAVRENRSRMIPLRRIGRPEDIADAIAFLASRQAAYITGANLLVDGGLSTTLMPSLARIGAANSDAT